MKYVSVEEIKELVENRVIGEYVLKYWNLHSDNRQPEITEGSLICAYLETADDANEIGYYLDTDINQPFHVNFKYDRGEINRFENDHYQFSLFKS